MAITTGAGDDIRSRLQAALGEAMKARDTAATSALRSVLAAIGNAEAVPVPDEAGPSSPDNRYVAGSAGSVGAGEAQRRPLAEEEITEIIRAEVGQREAAARQYEAAGHADRAARLRHEAEIITGHGGVRGPQDGK